MMFVTISEYMDPIWHMMARRNYFDTLDPLITLDNIENLLWVIEEKMKEMNIENSLIDGYPLRRSR